MLPPEQKSNVSLEDLLRLKRTERPSPEFWTVFERELRQKQLTALVQKRRWWHELPLALGRRVYIPAGAVAVLAFTLVTVRYSTAPLSVAQIQTPTARVAADTAVEILPVTVVSSSDNLGGRFEEPLVAAVQTLPESVLSPSVTKIETNIGVNVLPVSIAANAVETPSARSIAANLANLEQDEPDMVNAVMGSRLSSPARVQTVAAVQNTTDTDSSRKYRLIARYADHSLTPEPVAPALVRERIARRLGDDITDRISRIGVEGSRVSLKF